MTNLDSIYNLVDAILTETKKCPEGYRW